MTTWLWEEVDWRTEEPGASPEQLSRLAAPATRLQAAQGHSPLLRGVHPGLRLLQAPGQRGVRGTACQPLSKVGSLTPCHVDGQLWEPRRE